MYLHDDNVSKDEIKLRYYFELAAMAGRVVSRFSLFYDEFEDKRFDRAIKNLLIRSSCEFIVAVNTVRLLLRKGIATRDQCAQALRGYKLYLDEVRSDQRDRAALFSDNY
jgi:hypothetical protein